MNTLTQERLKEVLTYNSLTGEFFWNVDKSQGAKKGQKACASINNAGYLRIGIDGKRYNAHRLAWLYVYGHFPEKDIDHINRVRTDNRIDNLRVVTKAENAQNKISLGVFWHKKAKKWQAQIKVNKKHFYLGLHKTFDEARLAYVNAAKKLHTHHPHIAS